MSNQHPITPPPELVDKWYDEWLNADDLTHLDTRVAILAARWGADQELEACCEWIEDAPFGFALNTSAYQLRAARRPKPPSLKEQALAALEGAPSPSFPNLMRMLTPDQHDLIRRALEALPND